MRSSDITKKREKRPKPGSLFGALPSPKPSKPAPRRQPEPERRPPSVAKPLPLSPRGFAVDVTPPGKKVSKAARGAAFIKRQSFETYLTHHDDKLGPGQKKTINMLRHDATAFLNPKNAQHLSSLRQPSDELKKAIDADPKTRHMHQLVLKATAGPPPTQRQVSPYQAPDRRTQAKGAADVRRAQQAAGKGMPGGALSPQQLQAGIKAAGLFDPGHPKDWLSKLAGGAMESGVGIAPFLVHMATTDPRKSIPEVGTAIGKSYWETLSHPIRQLQNDPFTAFSNVVGAAGLGVGAIGRGLSAGRAVSEAGTVGAAARAAGVAAPTGVRAGKAYAAGYGFLHPKVRNLIDLHREVSPQAKARREIDIQHMSEHIQKVTDMPSAPTIKGFHPVMKTRKGLRDIRQDIRTTRATRRGERMERYAKGAAPPSAWAAGALKTAATELVDGVRAGTIYLRPAYLPNNWASNGFMNITHQGFLAPYNVGTAFFLYKNLTQRELNVFRSATGMTPVKAMGARKGGTGYVRAVTDPVARGAGKLADQPFRDASLIHELKRRGIRTVPQMKELAKRADNKDPAALRVLSEAGIDASEEVVRFKKMNAPEQFIGRNVLFVWNWVRGALRYGARFPFAHPVQTAVYGTAGRDIGNKEVQKRIGGLPPYLVGHVPIGGGKMINPWGVSPIGSTIDLGRAVAGTAKEIIPGMGEFDSHVMEDWTALLNPVLGGLLEARERPGGRTYFSSLVRNIAVSRLYQGLRHPGTASSTFPGTRKEALGNFFFGSLYPRKYDPKAIQASLERMNINHPEALIDGMKKRYQKKMGEPIPKAVENAYRSDLKELKKQKDYRKDFAGSKNTSSWEKLAPVDKAEGVLKYLQENKFMSKEDAGFYQQALNSPFANDESLKKLVSGLWATTHVGKAKETWNKYMKLTHQGELTKGR